MAWVPLCHPSFMMHHSLGTSVEQLTKSLLQGVLGEAGGFAYVVGTLGSEWPSGSEGGNSSLFACLLHGSVWRFCFLFWFPGWSSDPQSWFPR